MSEQELRAMVRDVLREALGKARPAATQGKGLQNFEQVKLANDADLAAFVQRIVALMDNTATAEALRSGRMRFSLAAQPATPAPKQPAHSVPPANGTDIELSGTITEARISKAAGSGTVFLAPDAVITPLGRDRARALGLKLERRR